MHCCCSDILYIYLTMIVLLITPTIFGRVFSKNKASKRKKIMCNNCNQNKIREQSFIVIHIITILQCVFCLIILIRRYI